MNITSGSVAATAAAAATAGPPPPPFLPLPPPPPPPPPPNYPPHTHHHFTVADLDVGTVVVRRDTLSSLDFLRDFVAHNKPVVLTGAWWPLPPSRPSGAEF